MTLGPWEMKKRLQTTQRRRIMRMITQTKRTSKNRSAVAHAANVDQVADDEPFDPASVPINLVRPKFNKGIFPYAPFVNEKQERCALSSTPTIWAPEDGSDRSWTKIGMRFVKPSTEACEERKTYITSLWRRTRKSMFVTQVEAAGRRRCGN